MPRNTFHFRSGSQQDPDSKVKPSWEKCRSVSMCKNSKQTWAKQTDDILKEWRNRSEGKGDLIQHKEPSVLYSNNRAKLWEKKSPGLSIHPERSLNWIGRPVSTEQNKAFGKVGKERNLLKDLYQNPTSNIKARRHQKLPVVTRKNNALDIPARTIKCKNK